MLGANLAGKGERVKVGERGEFIIVGGGGGGCDIEQHTTRPNLCRLGVSQRAKWA